VLVFLSVTAGISMGQDVKIVSMTKYLSNCLYNFSRNINWPEDKKSGDFVISIVGSKELFTEMSKLTQNMKVGMQPIQVKYFSTVNELNGFQHMVFVAEWQSSKINLLMQKITGSSTLVVTETEGMIAKGSMINFVPVEGIMKFEMNREGLKKNNLMASSVLEKMAILSN
jgi:hypothetical protein